MAYQLTLGHAGLERGEGRSLCRSSVLDPRCLKSCYDVKVAVSVAQKNSGSKFSREHARVLAHRLIICK